MSSGKFASITAGLLARKGEGQPWIQGGTQEPPRMPLAWRESEPLAARGDMRMDPRPDMRTDLGAGPQPAPPPPPTIGPAKDKSCAVRMTLHDFERLGILAVKDGVSRQKLLKDALARFLAGKAQDYACACLGNGPCERNCGEAG